ncbi:MAG: HicB family protein, partial [Oscillospiraceae bacterium]|nr:HicB family protein [Oscillospiraceae bacterium]
CPVTVFPSLVRDELDNRRVKTNVTIPAWVRELAQERGLNCSKLLEEAILDTAGIQSASRRIRDNQ